MTILILILDHGQQAGDDVGCDPTFEASCYSSETHLLKQGDVNESVRDLNLSKIKAGLFGSKCKSWNLLHQDAEVFLSKSLQLFPRFLSRT